MDGEADGFRQSSLMDAYLVAHGMAASYADSERADPAVVDQLITLDRRAADAVRSLQAAQSGDETATEAAVSALTSYAAQHSSVAQ